MGVFNSRDGESKQPFGAVETGRQVKFTVNAQRGDKPTLCVLRDGEKRPKIVEMEYLVGRYEASHLFVDPGLYFYWFRLASGREIRRFARGEGRECNAGDGALFQQTVYEKGYRAPEGYAGGVMYQIFPDRFAIAGTVLPSRFDDRVIRSDYSGVPNFTADSMGRVNNDYFGGNFLGIEGKLPYLVELGVSCIYLNPICEAHSNHRYNTADYMKPDPLLGSADDFARLCCKAHEAGIKVILDGVFSHTGANSVYFNKYGVYDSLGAYQSRDSRYYPWYKFNSFPDDYVSWWGFRSLPEIDEFDESYAEFVCGEGGVIDRWLSLGADGFRLDVADELPDAFIARLRAALKRSGNDKLLLGEVWEDASNKISYSARRRYLLGDELDSVMNYPFRTAILDFLKRPDAELFFDRVGTIVENYPRPMLDEAMNMISTHDTARAITVLSLSDEELASLPREDQAHRSLSRDEYLRGTELLKLAFALQFTLPGLPCIYYGDEIGMQGFRDPFCRGFMRWDAPDNHIRDELVKISRLRQTCKDVLNNGSLTVL
ncbi:MAG: glycoside hydrolase family 13 protein, partial [Oscillospiraceae bacterium]